MQNSAEQPDSTRQFTVPLDAGPQDTTLQSGLPSTVPFDGPVAAPPVKPQPGPRFIGKYEILSELAAGGMGVVYKARDPHLNRTVALKTIRSGAFARPEEVLRFTREAQAVAHLSHPNIVQVFEVGAHEGQQYFTMAFAPGGSLAMNRARFESPQAVAGLIEKLARAVHYAHSKGICTAI